MTNTTKPGGWGRAQGEASARAVRLQKEICAIEGNPRRSRYRCTRSSIAMPVRVRSDLRNESVTGPLVIQEYDTSVVVPPGCSASLDAIGNILIDVSAP